jgi:hypothetical protein
MLRTVKFAKKALILKSTVRLALSYSAVGHIGNLVGLYTTLPLPGFHYYHDASLHLGAIPRGNENVDSHFIFNPINEEHCAYQDVRRESSADSDCIE